MFTIEKIFRMVIFSSFCVFNAIFSAYFLLLFTFSLFSFSLCWPTYIAVSDCRSPLPVLPDLCSLQRIFFAFVISSFGLFIMASINFEILREE